MKIFSLGKINKQIFLILIIYLIIVTGTRLLEYHYISKLKINLSLKIVITFGFNVFYCVPEVIISKKCTQQKENNTIRCNKICCLMKNRKKTECKGIIYLILIFIIYLAYIYGTNIYFTINHEKAPLMESELTRSLELVYFLILSRLTDKTSYFYRHHYIPIVISLFMGIMRFIINLNSTNYKFDFPSDILLLFLLLIIPLIESSIFYVFQWYMKYKYYSPFFICFIFGIVFLFMSSLLLLIFMFIDCDETTMFCQIMSGKMVVDEGLSIFILIASSILYSFYFFIEIVTINIFSVSL